MLRDGDVLVVEEHSTVLAAVMRRVMELERQPGELRAVDHDRALAMKDGGGISVAFISALRHPRVQDNDPTMPLLGGPEVVAHLREIGCEGDLIVYGSRASWPEVNITSRQAGATSVFTETALLRSIPQIFVGRAGPFEVPDPTPDDFHHLGLEPDAQLWDAITAMRHIRPRDVFPHGDAWERVAQTEPNRKVEDRTREYINDRVGPLLGITTGHGGHRRITALISRVVGLPAQRSACEGMDTEVRVPTIHS